jgi:hypothetical protein
MPLPTQMLSNRPWYAGLTETEVRRMLRLAVTFGHRARIKYKATQVLYTFASGIPGQY